MQQRRGKEQGREDKGRVLKVAGVGGRWRGWMLRRGAPGTVVVKENGERWWWERTGNGGGEGERGTVILREQ